LQGFFSCRKADDAGGLSPGKEDNEAARKKAAKISTAIAEFSISYTIKNTCRSLPKASAGKMSY